MAAAQHVDVLIVGAGHAGTQLAVALTKADPAADVTLVGDEPELPYERPGLTKKLLYGADDPPPVPLRSEQYWDRSPVRLRRGVRVVGVDAGRRTVSTATGETLGYRTLVWAAGGRPVRTGLPGEDLPGVHSIRDFADLTRLRADLPSARRAVVVGGGYLGLEAAAGLTHLGLAVTVVETAPRLLARVTGEVVSGFFAALHRSAGVDVRTGVGVAAFVGAGDRVSAVRLADGTVLPADLVVVGVGMRPVVATLTAAAGAAADRLGLVVDDACRTTLPDVFAIGDCASQHTPWSATRTPMRVESVHNAGQHAGVVARALAGLPPLLPPPPRFWSTQFGRELKTVGLPAPTDHTVVRGDPAGGSFTVAYLRDGRLLAVDTVDRARDFARAQALIAAGWHPDAPATLADPAVDLPRVEQTVAGRNVAAVAGAGA